MFILKQILWSKQTTEEIYNFFSPSNFMKKSTHNLSPTE